MDELQFRRAMLTEPNNKEEEFLDAISADPSKRKLAQEVHDLDEKIKQALQVPVPDDLADKLILRQTLANHQQGKRKKRMHLAIAASVALFGGLLLNNLHFFESYNHLGDYSLAHVYHEERYFGHNHKISDNEAISLNSLNTKMATFNGSFKSTLGKLAFADYCRFGGMKSLHLVYQGKTSPVNVFIVPKNENIDFIEKFDDNNWFGKSVGFDQTNVIVVADKNESLTQWQSKLSDNINWEI